MELAETILLESVINSYDDLDVENVESFLGFSRDEGDVLPGHVGRHV